MERLVMLNEQMEPNFHWVDRAYAHRYGIPHLAVHIWVAREDFKQVLIQKRSYEKDSYPGEWDISVAGHVTYGDTVHIAALRELEEELGCFSNKARLACIGTYSHERKGTFHGTPWHDRELDYVYLYQAPNAFEPQIQEEEIEEVRWVTLEQLEEIPLCASKKDITLLHQYLKMIK